MEESVAKDREYRDCRLHQFLSNVQLSCAHGQWSEDLKPELLTAARLLTIVEFVSVLMCLCVSVSVCQLVCLLRVCLCDNARHDRITFIVFFDFPTTQT